MKPIYVPKNPHEKALQRALIQYRDPKNRDLVREALRRAGREDLIGFDESRRAAGGGARGAPSKGKGTPKEKGTPRGMPVGAALRVARPVARGKSSRSTGGGGKGARQSAGKDEADARSAARAGIPIQAAARARFPEWHTGGVNRKESPGEGQRGRGTKRKG